MVLLGLSLLIISVSFLCYQHFPLTLYSFSTPRSSPPKEDEVELQVIEIEKSTKPAPKTSSHKKVDSTMESRGIECKNEFSTTALEDNDRKAMPPPPLPLENNSMPSTSRTLAYPPDLTLTPALIESSIKDIRTSIVSRTPSLQDTLFHQNTQKKSNSDRMNIHPVATIRGMTQIDVRTSTAKNFSSSLSSLPKGSLIGVTAPPSRSTASTKSSKRVLLAPGHSPLDWARLINSDVVLTGLAPGTQPYIKVPPSLLKKYTGRKGQDAWTVLSGKVYNITPYIPFHPGGKPELLRCAGRDGTKLFAEIHPWVNWEGMLAKCMVGIAVDEDEMHDEEQLNQMD
ncbi:Bgt-166 [Blumeria graminis f. sp. tritici]|uniref:Bgt-166 n=3 Tax=Blumeria graminis f. sp. tritici TaxID=62690 RepID=A0A9X9PRI2_BLUGR|nr:Bgt-166 [Blumeria graminis f. sp. tritici]